MCIAVPSVLTIRVAATKVAVLLSSAPRLARTFQPPESIQAGVPSSNWMLEIDPIAAKVRAGDVGALVLF
jgi:hypothetical protein